MGQKKGQTGNPFGRPKGTPNKSTSELRTWIMKIVSENGKQLETDLKKLEPKERWSVIEKLLPYVVKKKEGNDDEKTKSEIQRAEERRKMYPELFESKESYESSRLKHNLTA
jgi:SpoVK/Ycf46/Vps4 family AAA+-type ATPase